jgi:hypothetical protein
VEPIEERKRRLTGLLQLPHDGLALKSISAIIYKHACALGCEGICQSGLVQPTVPAGC